MEDFNQLLKLVPHGPEWIIPWHLLADTPVSGISRDMERTPQNPQFHGEGNVWTHTKLVCQALADMDGFRCLREPQRQMLFLAALMHDVGKPACTHLEDGRWTSPNHGSVGAGITRRLLWQNYGLCGSPDALRIRETVCNLIRYHAVPAHAISNPDAHRHLRRIAANGELMPLFSLELLCMLARADAQGRICDDREDMLYRTDLAAELAKEASCYENSCVFYSDFGRFAYFCGRNIQPGQPIHDDTWGEVILISGLPGTGKDTWISANHPDLPMISLDDIRAELKIGPTDNQGRVIETARERARILLRRKQPFIWNATNLSPIIRQRQIGLFTDYGARTRIVYLETAWPEMLRRNQGRPDAVPERAICHMMTQLTPPEPWEANRVEWLCV